MRYSLRATTGGQTYRCEYYPLHIWVADRNWINLSIHQSVNGLVFKPVFLLFLQTTAAATPQKLEGGEYQRHTNNAPSISHSCLRGHTLPSSKIFTYSCGELLLALGRRSSTKRVYKLSADSPPLL